MYLISDLHLFHKNIKKYESKRQYEDEIEFFINKLNQVNGDIYILGDLFFDLYNRKEDAKRFISSIKNPIYLIRGNHDKYPIDLYIEIGLKGVMWYKIIDDIILTHLPLNKEHFITYYKRYNPPEGFMIEFFKKYSEIFNIEYEYNIHGHLHSLTFEGISNNPKYFDVSCEKLDFNPINFEKVKELLCKV